MPCSTFGCRSPGRPRPALHQIAGLVEHQDRQTTAQRLTPAGFCWAAFARRQRARPLDDPDAIEPVDGDARPAQDQLFGSFGQNAA
jgi:hypothetical protein